jgi:Holliday junction resolvase RusA-like endonuclease
VISFFVPGIPKPAGSKRAFPIRRAGGGMGVRVTDDCAKSKDWKTTVAWEARRSYEGPLLQEQLSVRLRFVMPRPKGHFGKRGLKPYAPLRPTTKPDVLKLARGVEDALTGVVWRDDSLIVVEYLEKLYGEAPGVHINIEELAA